jgi:hypothetical protein
MNTVLNFLKWIALGLVFFFITGVLFSPAYVGGKPTTADLVRDGCNRYLQYAQYAATTGQFRFDISVFSAYAETNYSFSRAGIETLSSSGLTNETHLSALIRYSELYGSKRAIFNTNQDYWAKTNFSIRFSRPEPVILCKQPVMSRFERSFCGWRWSEHKSVFFVGYSDGTTARLLPEQFNKLDLTGFVPLSSLGIDGFHVCFDERSFKP